MWPAQVFVEYHPAEVDSFIKVADRIEDAFPSLQVEGVERADIEQSTMVLKAQEAEVLSFTAGRVPSSQALVDALEKAGFSAE